MKILTQIIETTKEEMKTFFRDRCQSKIEKFRKSYNTFCAFMEKTNNSIYEEIQ